MCTVVTKPKGFMFTVFTRNPHISHEDIQSVEGAELHVMPRFLIMLSRSDQPGAVNMGAVSAAQWERTCLATCRAQGSISSRNTHIHTHTKKRGKKKT